MRKVTLLAVVCAFLFLASFASAQQGDAWFGGGTLMSSGTCNFNSGCPEKGGFYPTVGADVIFHKRVGFAFETAWRGSQALYGGLQGETFRPILTDFNGVYQPRISKKVGLDLMAGVGWESVRFYSQNTYNTGNCFYFGQCFVSSHHFLMDVGGGIRYYVWRHLFVRPEVRYYYVNNNTNDFTSNNVFRVGASIGYTIGGPE